MPLLESGEMYLETIYLLKKKNDNLHSVDVVDRLGYSKSSVSRAVNLLREQGYIAIDDTGKIDFTEVGKQKSGEIYSRHSLLTELLTYFGVDSAVAEADACRMEHVISSESISAVEKFLASCNKTS